MYSYFGSKHAIYDAMFADGARAFREHFAAQSLTGDSLHDLTSGLRTFIEFGTAHQSRYQLLFQRTIPGFEPLAESYAVAVAAFADMRQQLREIGITADADLDLLTALGTGLADQQISNDPGGVTGGCGWSTPRRRCSCSTTNNEPGTRRGAAHERAADPRREPAPHQPRGG